MSLDVATFFWRAPPRAERDAALAALAGDIRSAAPDQPLPESLCLAARSLAGERPAPLDSLRLGRLAARIAAHPGGQRGLTPLRVLLTGALNTSPLAADLPAAGLARGLLIETVETAFDIAPALAAGAAPPPPGPFHAVLLLSDPQAGPDPTGLVEGLRRVVGAPVILATLPQDAGLFADGYTEGSASRRIAEINAAIAQGAAARDWLMFDLARLAAEVGTSRFLDPARRLAARTPFDPAHGPLVADRLCALLAAMAGRAARALVLDLDNTLWGGVIGDDGLDHIVLGQGSPAGEAHLAVQRLALDLRARGIALAVCSKNTEAVARLPFERHPDMLIRTGDIAVFRADWSDKATGLAAIAAELDLSPASLVLLDDNPAERAWVRAALPGVQVPELPDDPAGFPVALYASGLFEHLPLGAEDLGRAASYAARAEGRAADLAGGYQAWLAGLEMRLTVAPFDAIGRDRIVQLIARSNQFNLTTPRYSPDEVAALQADADVLAWQARLSDRLADHGMIGIVVLRGIQGPDWLIDSWLMSCRVLERGVEQALLNHLVGIACAAGARSLTGRYIDTGRNGLVSDFYDRMGFAPAGQGLWRLALDEAKLLPTTIKAEDPGGGRHGPGT